jgi:hypothetical protein
MFTRKIIDKEVHTQQKKIEEKKEPFEPILNKEKTPKNFKLEEETSLPENESKKSTLEENTHKTTPLERNMKTILVSPLSKTVTAEQLTDIFSKCGPIEKIQYKWIDILKGIHRANIEFKTKEALENALKMNQMHLGGSLITIKQKARYVAFVSGLPEMYTAYLKSYFSKCGECQVYREKPGTAFIQYRLKNSLELAISLSGTKIFENTIKVISVSLFDIEPEKESKKIAPVPEVEEIPKKMVVSKVESSSDEESSEEEIPKSTSKKMASVPEVEEIPKSTSKKRTLVGAEEPKTKIQKINNGTKQQDELKEMENELIMKELVLKKKELELKKKELELKMKEMKIKENELRLKEEDLKIKEKKLEK